MYKVGDRIVHPSCGVGHIVKLSIEQFVKGEKRPYYEVDFPNSTVWIPFGQTETGIRALSAKSEIEVCRRILAAPAVELDEDFRVIQKNLTSKLSLGTLVARCEVVRDLTAYSWKKHLNNSLAAILKVANSVLCQEWAVVEGLPVEQAENEIESLLEKGRREMDHE